MADRAGRVKAAPKPKLTGLGSGVAASHRRARCPRPARGARPRLIACTDESRPTRNAGANAAIETTVINANTTVTSIHSGRSTEFCTL